MRPACLLDDRVWFAVSRSDHRLAGSPAVPCAFAPAGSGSTVRRVRRSTWPRGVQSPQVRREAWSAASVSCVDLEAVMGVPAPQIFDADAADVAAAHRLLAYVPADMALWPQLTGAENIRGLRRAGIG